MQSGKRAPTERTNDAIVYSAQSAKARRSYSTAKSSEKLEKVVNAPRMPVVRKRRISVEVFQTRAMDSTSTPMTNEPTTFTISVAYGKPMPSR